MQKQKKLKVSVDKSHLFTLGEKMYRESIEFVRELVSNAYDADATEVRVDIEENRIVIGDDGSGMNEKGLFQFFTIGSEEKRKRNVSAKFGRKKIGQFGIGKFSALALCDRFIVESVKGKYKYQVIFDRASWKDSSDWDLPIVKEPVNVFNTEGTKMILDKLHKKVSVSEVEKYLKKSVPIRAKKFAIFLNNKRISAKDVPGKVIFINRETMYGKIEGRIVLALYPQDLEEPGVECRVKEVFIKRELFGLNKKYTHGINRVSGYVNADFLPLISSRGDFITDTPEYNVFKMIMRTELEKVLQDFKKQKETSNLKKINKELQDVMKQVREALSLNPDFVPKGKAVARLKKAGRKKIQATGANFNNSVVNDKNKENKNKDENNKKPENKDKKDENKKVNIEPLTVKRIRMNKLGIACGIVSLGERGPEVISQGNAVYINQDHPVYQKVYKRKDLFSMHLLRLISQEVVLMKKLKITAREAFEWQSKILSDALSGKKK